MGRLTLMVMTLATATATTCADGLQIALSRRIPCQGETVRFSAHLENWAPPERGTTVTFTVDGGSGERPIGKALAATDPANPLEPGVEWTPRRSGLYRVTARVEGTQLSGKILVPVTVQPVFFCWYGQRPDAVQWMTHHLTSGREDIAACHARGALALKHVGGVSYFGGPRWENVRTQVDWAELTQRVLQDYTEIEPYDGISIDELGMWDQHPAQTELALGFWEILKKVRARRPTSFIAAWQFGSLTPLECNLFRDTVDLVMCEVYQNYFRAWYDQHTFYEFIRQRVEMARTMMIIKKTVIGLSLTELYGGVRPDELEDQIRAIRVMGPEMRGLAFFTSGPCDPELLKAASDCCYRYWVKPVVGFFSEADLTLSHYQPSHGGTVRLFATVHNVGGMDARRVRVRFWDGDPAAGGVQIAVSDPIPRLPAASWVDPEARNVASVDPPETMRREGFGMVTVSAQWRARRGPHDLWAEILPDDQYTTLRAFEHKRVTVK